MNLEDFIVVVQVRRLASRRPGCRRAAQPGSATQPCTWLRLSGQRRTGMPDRRQERFTIVIQAICMLPRRRQPSACC